MNFHVIMFFVVLHQLNIKGLLMQIPVIDRSNYLKGLLITARKDKQLTESEKEIIKEIIKINNKNNQ